MDISSIITTLWGKVSKPLPNILVGCVFIFMAPDDFSWFGFIFLALGASGFLEWIYPHILAFHAHGKIKNKINDLSDSEQNALNTLRVNGRISITSQSISEKGLDEFNTLMSLEAKKLINQDRWSNYGGSGYSFNLPYGVKKALKDIIEERAKS